MDAPVSALGTSPLSTAAADAFASSWTAAWNAHDLDRILAHYREDVVFRSPFAATLEGAPGGVVRGHAALRDYFARALAAFPDLRFEPISALPGVGSVLVHYGSIEGREAMEIVELDEGGLVARAAAHYGPSGGDGASAELRRSEQLARDWVAAWNAHDLDRIEALYEADVVFSSALVAALGGEPEGVLHGHAALRRHAARGLAAYPDLRFELATVLSGTVSPGPVSIAFGFRSRDGREFVDVIELGARGLIARSASHHGGGDVSHG